MVEVVLSLPSAVRWPVEVEAAAKEEEAVAEGDRRVLWSYPPCPAALRPQWQSPNCHPSHPKDPHPSVRLVDPPFLLPFVP